MAAAQMKNRKKKIKIKACAFCIDAVDSKSDKRSEYYEYLAKHITDAGKFIAPNDNEHSDLNFSGSSDEEGILCSCPRCCHNKEVLVINANSILMVKFKLQELQECDSFNRKLIRICRTSGVRGFVTYDKTRTKAEGELHGIKRQLNSIKVWLKEQLKYLVDSKNLYVGLLELQLGADPQKFCEWIDGVPVIELETQLDSDKESDKTSDQASDKTSDKTSDNDAGSSSDESTYRATSDNN